MNDFVKYSIDENPQRYVLKDGAYVRMTESDIPQEINPNWKTPEEMDIIEEIKKRIYDPGAYVKRGEDFTEPVWVWQARAVAELIPTGERIERLKNELDDARETIGVLTMEIAKHKEALEESVERLEAVKRAFDPLKVLFE